MPTHSLSSPLALFLFPMAPSVMTRFSYVFAGSCTRPTPPTEREAPSGRVPSLVSLPGFWLWPCRRSAASPSELWTLNEEPNIRSSGLGGGTRSHEGQEPESGTKTAASGSHSVLLFPRPPFPSPKAASHPGFVKVPSPLPFQS